MIYTTQKTPSPIPGAQLEFDIVLRDELSKFLSKPDNAGKQNARIKICGDGTKVSRIANYVCLSFSLLDDEENVLSAKGVHTVAIINASETYENIATGFADVIKDINALINIHHIDNDGKQIELEFFLGGDYKFLLLVCGLSGATSNYACLYCKVHKDQRWDTSKDLAYYNQPPLARSIDELRNPPKMNYCAVNKPLFDIPLTHIVVDELHLLLRVTDVLTRNLVEECLEWDEHETITKGAIAPTRRYHVKELTDTISSCGVTFSVWEKLNENHQGTGKYEYTSLMGRDKKRVLERLPEKLPNILHPETVSTVQKLWVDFKKLYSYLTSTHPDTTQLEEYFHLSPFHTLVVYTNDQMSRHTCILWFTTYQNL